MIFLVSSYLSPKRWGGQRSEMSELQFFVPGLRKVGFTRSDQTNCPRERATALIHHLRICINGMNRLVCPEMPARRLTQNKWSWAYSSFGQNLPAKTISCGCFSNKFGDKTGVKKITH